MSSEITYQACNNCNKLKLTVDNIFVSKLSKAPYKRHVRYLIYL